MEINEKEYKAVVMEAEKLSDNGTFYTKAAVEKAVQKMKEDVRKGRLFGELDHPYQNDFRIGFVSLERSAVQWTDVWMEGNVVYGKFRVLPTPYGQLVKKLIDNQINFGFSIRGSGKTKVSYKEGKRVEMVDDFTITAIDVVAVPSFEASRILQEGKSSAQECIKLIECIEKTLYKYL